jgi:hypothetical protein
MLTNGEGESMTDTPLDFAESLLYRANNDFIEGDRAEPVNADEIRANLESRLESSESTKSLWAKRGVAWILVIVNLVFAFVFLVVALLIVNPDRITSRGAGFIMIVGYGVGWLILKALFGNRFAIKPVYETKPADAYQSLIEKAEVVNGTIVDVVKLGEVLITYSVKTPTLQEIQRTYKTSLTHYTREDIGKEVAVLYFSENINALL